MIGQNNELFNIHNANFNFWLHHPQKLPQVHQSNIKPSNNSMQSHIQSKPIQPQNMIKITKITLSCLTNYKLTLPMTLETQFLTI